MKTVTIRNNSISVYADSAVGRDAMPLFLPEHANDWKAEIVLAFRVGRLGKSVSEKFALRYIDAATVAAILSCDGDPAWLRLIDSAVTPGRWMPMPQAYAYSSAIGEAASSLTLDKNLVEQQLAKAVSLVSSYATIKTGDIIIPDLPGLACQLATDTVLTTCLNDEQCMRLKIK